ncbi:MAG: ABC transporter permease [Phenylobacterium sp.]
MSLIKETVAATAMNLKGLPQRIGASLVTVIGVATTVAVMVSLLAIGAGLSKSANRNLDPARVMVLPSGSQSEYAGSLSRDAAELVGQTPGVRKTADGRPMVQPMAMVIVEVTKKSDGETTNIPIRGSGPMARVIDPSMKLVEGRMYRPAVHELIVGKNVRAQFRNFDLGDKIVLRGTEWTVVGIFESGGSMMENLVIGDLDTVMAAFERTGYQSVEATLQSPGSFQTFKDGLTSNPQLDVDAKRFSTYVADQLKQLTTVIDFVGYFVGTVMAIGAVIGALNTMYSAVEARTREIATLRAIGFGGTAVILSVMIESLVLAVPGALLGAGVAWLIFNGHAISTVGLTFPLAVTWPLVGTGVFFALAIGLIGGFAPSIRAARLPVATALRAI